MEATIVKDSIFRLFGLGFVYCFFFDKQAVCVLLMTSTALSIRLLEIPSMLKYVMVAEQINASVSVWKNSLILS